MHSNLQVPDIDNKTSYCLRSTEKVTVTFKKHVIVSGVVLQGDSEKNGWITEFALSYQNSKDQVVMTEISTVSKFCHLILIGYDIFSNDVDIYNN